MKPPANPNLQDIHEKIIQNIQKGDVYRISFANDSHIYEGIPLASSDMRAGESDAFDLRVADTHTDEAVERRLVRDVVSFEKCN